MSKDNKTAWWRRKPPTDMLASQVGKRTLTKSEIQTLYSTISQSEYYEKFGYPEDWKPMPKFKPKEKK